MNKPVWTTAICLCLVACAPIDKNSAAPPAKDKSVETTEELIQKVVDLTLETYRAQNANNTGTWKRDVHAKSHGLLDGTFTVRDDLPEHLRIGVFSHPGHEYRARVRFSNGNSANLPDSTGDGRGMAIKLYDVPGAKILPPDKGYDDTQDFLMINNPNFFVKDVAEYLQLDTDLVNPNGRSIENYFKPDPNDESTWRTREQAVFDTISNKKVGNVLALTYWSMTPFSLGADQAVKYEARPCVAQDNTVPENPSHDFLREKLVQHMDQGPACFEFLVQLRTGDMPLDDARVEWSMDESPFIPVARLELPQQEFDTNARNTMDENMTFSPWHALPEHRPLGSLNAVRGKVYEAISELRHAHNEVTSGAVR